MSSKLWIALTVAFSGQVMYHFCQKAVAPNLHPVLALIVFYVVAAIGSLPLFLMLPLDRAIGEQLTQINPAVIGVGIAIVLIEVGFLLAYRAGGELSTAFVYTSAAVACALLLLGVMIHSESLNASKVAGIAFSLLGIYLISKQ